MPGKTPFRRYKNNQLDTWINKKCLSCGRYIKKTRHKVCVNCGSKWYERPSNRLRNYFRYYTLKTIRETLHIKIPAIIRVKLWEYC